jgi:mannose-1-phosphate guanylyltransferase/mannose-6-phosphate isomerase
MPDALLAAEISRAQDIKRLFYIITERSILQARSLPRIVVPCHCLRLVLAGCFMVSRISVHPVAAL